MKNGPSQVTNYKPDAYGEAMRKMATSFAGGNTYGGPNAGMTSAMDFWKSIMGAGQTGAAAASGDAGATSQLMNPYMSLMNPMFARQRSQAVQGANDQATAAGAFGGDRSGISAAVAGNLADQNQSQFQVGQFNDAQQRALQMMNFGMGASQNMFQGGQTMFNLPQQWQMQQLGLLGAAPSGSTTETPTQWSPLMMGAGLATSLFPGGKFLGAATPQQRSA